MKRKSVTALHMERRARPPHKITLKHFLIGVVIAWILGGGAFFINLVRGPHDKPADITVTYSSLIGVPTAEALIK